MKNHKTIHSMFALPAFVAGARLNGVFGDRYARIKMIAAHWYGIASYCHPENKVSPGLVEGIINKTRVLQRRVYGYRDDEYLKLKIVAAFLPPLPRNAIINPHVSA